MYQVHEWWNLILRWLLKLMSWLKGKVAVNSEMSEPLAICSLSYRSFFSGGQSSLALSFTSHSRASLRTNGRSSKPRCSATQSDEWT